MNMNMNLNEARNVFLRSLLVVGSAAIRVSDIDTETAKDRETLYQAARDLSDRGCVESAGRGLWRLTDVGRAVRNGAPLPKSRRDHVRKTVAAPVTSAPPTLFIPTPQDQKPVATEVPTEDEKPTHGLTILRTIRDLGGRVSRKKLLRAVPDISQGTLAGVIRKLCYRGYLNSPRRAIYAINNVGRAACERGEPSGHRTRVTYTSLRIPALQAMVDGVSSSTEIHARVLAPWGLDSSVKKDRNASTNALIDLKLRGCASNPSWGSWGITEIGRKVLAGTLRFPRRKRRVPPSERSLRRPVNVRFGAPETAVTRRVPEGGAVVSTGVLNTLLRDALRERVRGLIAEVRAIQALSPETTAETPIDAILAALAEAERTTTA